MIEIKGKFKVIIYHNETSFFTVAKFALYEVEEKLITVTGIFKELQYDMLYRLEGDYAEHSKYGYQFQCTSFKRVLPTDYDSQIAFLSSPVFPGIGSKMATTIIDKLGENAFQMIKDNPDILDTIKGMSLKKKNSIINGLKDNGNLEEIIGFFTTHGLGIRNIMKLEKIYGEKVIDVVYNNPYQLVEEVDGFGFATADKLAKSIEFDMYSFYRTRAGLLSAVMDECFRRGDTYLDYSELIPLLVKKIGHQNFDLDEVLEDLRKSKLLYIEGTKIYHYSQYLAEEEISSYFADFICQPELVLPKEDITRFINEIEDNNSIIYDDVQKEAIDMFLKKPFLILTGGPGTGKTTIVKAMIELYHKLYPNKSIAICAPTGRAAKRLTELTGVEATTIHRMLKWNLESNTFAIDEQTPLPADLLVIDEFSMVDPWLLHQVVKAGANLNKILFIGDEDQLPSVSCGATLRDFIASEKFPIVRLSKIFRQSEGSDVVTLAHQIKLDEKINIDDMREVKFYEIEKNSVRELVNKVVLLGLQKGYDLSQIQVLVPKYAGDNGIDAINHELQKLCNPPAYEKLELKVGYKIFREGDKILQLKNQIDDDVYNGDIGILEEVCLKEYEDDNIDKLVVRFDDNIVVYSGEKLQNISHAYCVSIHKSQGSEYQIVIMPILKEYYNMLSKKLLYTGITRAKKSLILIGDKSLFEKGLSINDRERITTLKERFDSKVGKSLYELW
ncbi:MAG: ATP-dependent RecD-like DNA helicase [Erysipelotrichales bacterium]|nr:ATP-dependent RecD-like DNA helicase [Erysipelotrichales bacterium]